MAADTDVTGARADDDWIDAKIENGESINLKEPESGSGVQTINEQHRLSFARWVLGCLFVLVCVVFIAYAIVPTSEPLKQMFEFVKIGALPLVTLVIGFYFPSSGNGN